MRSIWLVWFGIWFIACTVLSVVAFTSNPQSNFDSPLVAIGKDLPGGAILSVLFLFLTLHLGTRQAMQVEAIAELSSDIAQERSTLRRIRTLEGIANGTEPWMIQLVHRVGDDEFRLIYEIVPIRSADTGTATSLLS
jgi:hypothetical protein